MGTSFSAETNTSIQDTLSETINEFISENSSVCETVAGADASVNIKDITCEKDLILGDITVDSNTNINVECLQSSVSQIDFNTFLEDKLTNELKKETENLIGMNLSLDKNTTLNKSVQKVVNKVKTSNMLTCLTKNLSSSTVILENIKGGGKCVTGNINAESKSVTNAKCIQEDESVMKVVSELNKDIETFLSSKTSGTGIVIMIIVVSIVALIIFIMIKKMKSKPSSGMTLPMPSQLPMAYPV